MIGGSSIMAVFIGSSFIELKYIVSISHIIATAIKFERVVKTSFSLQILAMHKTSAAIVVPS